MKWFAYLVLFYPLLSAYAENKLYHYDPDVIELMGTIERQTFPGPPNYESIKAGDSIEKGWYLRLEQPIDVTKSPNDQNQHNETPLEKNIKVLHLTWGNEDVSMAMKNAAGVKMILEGYLFHQTNGHHHARVLMHINKIKTLSK